SGAAERARSSDAADERCADDPILLVVMQGRVALARARPPGTAHVLHARARIGTRGRFLESVANRAPRPHVLWLLLGPDDLAHPRVRRDEGRHELQRERIELLEPRDRDRGRRRTELVADDVVVDLAAAEDEATHGGVIGPGIVENGFERTEGEIVERRGRLPE